MLICVTLVSFYYGFLLVNDKAAAEKRDRFEALIHGTKLRNLDYIGAIEHIFFTHAPDPKYVVTVYEHSQGARPFYILDALAPDEQLYAFDIEAFNLFNETEIYDKKVRSVIDDPRYSADVRAKAIWFSYLMAMLDNHQCADEEKVLIDKMDTSELRIKSENRFSDSLKTAITAYLKDLPLLPFQGKY